MISLFSNDESQATSKAIPVPSPIPAAKQPVVTAAAQPAYSTAQHPAVSKTVAPASAPAPEKHGGIFSWLSIGKAKKRLQMLETVSLGEKRFVALVQVDGRQFLIGGAPSNVGMIAELAPEESFHQVLQEATQGVNELPAPQTVSAAPVQAAPVAPTVVPVAPLPATPVPQAAPVEAAEEEESEADEAFSAYPQPPVFGTAPVPLGSPIQAETPAEPAASVQAAPTAVKAPIPFPVNTQSATVVAQVAAPKPEPAPVVPEEAAPLAQSEVSPSPALAAPSPTHHISVAPFALAEAVLPAGATFSPAPAPAKPSLPPHVAARLAELQAAAQLEQAQQAKPEHTIFPDDLSLEEPISFSPSLLAAMQQRARTALLKDLASAIAAQEASAQEAVLEAVAEPVAPKLPSVSAPAPSFTFQFSPTLTSTTRAIRMPANPNAKLQGAA